MNQIVSLEDLMGKKFPEQTWLVDRILPAAALTIVSAPANSYKTYICLDMALAIASNKPLFGQFQTQQANVLFVDEESGGRLLQQRVFQLGADKALPVYFHTYQDFTVNDKGVQRLLKDCDEHDIKLVIFDSLTRIHTKDENSAGEMASVFKHLKTLVAKEIAVIVIHHNRKPGIRRSSAGNEMRGSSDILAAVDCHIALSRNSNQVTFHQTKQRYAPEIKPFDLLVNSSEFSFAFEYQGEADTKSKSDEALKKEVFNQLNDYGELCQKDLLILLDEADVPCNEHKLRALVKEMLTAGELVKVKGEGNTQNYRLGPTAPDLPEPENPKYI
jgi:archaellum biogenesis ATPase FlaH